MQCTFGGRDARFGTGVEVQGVAPTLNWQARSSLRVYSYDSTKKSAGLVYTQINVPAKTRCLLTREEFRERLLVPYLEPFVKP
jgi:hypothetical protein